MTNLKDDLKKLATDITLTPPTSPNPSPSEGLKHAAQPTNNASEQEPLINVSGVNAIHEFASGLTQRIQNLNELETTYQIVPGQATEILTSMIESFVYAAARTIASRRSERIRADIEAETLQLIDERDYAQEWADKLAYALFTIEDIGEHSNNNNPWGRALELLQCDCEPDCIPREKVEAETLRCASLPLHQLQAEAAAIKKRRCQYE